jgi:hypothetical protein
MKVHAISAVRTVDRRRGKHSSKNNMTSLNPTNNTQEDPFLVLRRVLAAHGKDGEFMCVQALHFGFFPLSPRIFTCARFPRHDISK